MSIAKAYANGLASVKKGEIHDFVILRKLGKTILVITLRSADHSCKSTKIGNDLQLTN